MGIVKFRLVLIYCTNIQCTNVQQYKGLINTHCFPEQNAMLGFFFYWIYVVNSLNRFKVCFNSVNFGVSRRSTLVSGWECSSSYLVITCKITCKSVSLVKSVQSSSSKSISSILLVGILWFSSCCHIFKFWFWLNENNYWFFCIVSIIMSIFIPGNHKAVNQFIVQAGPFSL